MASLAIAATRSLIGYGCTRTSSTLPRTFSSCSRGGLAKFGKGVMNCASGGPQRCNFSARIAAATTVSSSYRSLSVAASKSSSTTIQVGDKLAEAELSFLDKDDNVQTITVSELTDGKKVVLFAVPAAFSPTCSAKQMPAFVANADELRARGIDTIACVSVNDVFVQKAWGQSLGVGDKVLILSDGNGNFTRGLGVQLDMSGMGMGVRSKRYSLLADNGVVKQLNLEEGAGYTISGPEEILKALAPTAE